MKRSKLTLGVIAGLLSVSGLAACNGPKYSPEGYILTYKNASGETLHYTAEDLFGAYGNDASSNSTIFNEVYKLIVRNYFEVEAGQSEIRANIIKEAENDVDSVKKKAKDNADDNKTNFDDEFYALIESYGCKDEEDLRQKFIYDRELTEFEDQFYKSNINHLRDSRTDDADGDKYEGYIQSQVPYHISHILVKVTDTSGTNYNDGSISEQNAINLYSVASALAEGSKSFGYIAGRDLNEDDTARAAFGDLGIMDKSTSFINEFKLGIYAYENLLAGSAKTAAAQNSNIAIEDEIKENLKNSVVTRSTNAEGAVSETKAGLAIGEIPYGVFEKLNEVADVTKGYEDATVNSGDSIFYPRNVYYNKYLNRHNISVITAADVSGATLDSTGTKAANENEWGNGADTFATAENKGFVDASICGITLNHGATKILATDIVRDSSGNVTSASPILVVRGGTGSGDSGYQGIHFIVIKKSGLESNATLSEYYTTKYPGQTGYPTNEDGTNKTTYVNNVDKGIKDYKTRAEEVESKIRNFDSNLNKYIFQKYYESQKIQFADEKIYASLTKWIESSKIKSDFDDYNSWEETWRSYTEMLSSQSNERDGNLLISEVCAIGYQGTDHYDSNGNLTGIWAKGGLCGEKK